GRRRGLRRALGDTTHRNRAPRGARSRNPNTIHRQGDAMTSTVAARVDTPTPHRRSKLRLRYTLIGWSFILPNFLGFALITLIPVVQLFFISLTDQNILGKGDFVGIENFQKLLGDPQFQRSFVNTLYFAVLH